jgi:hypothetical protein
MPLARIVTRSPEYAHRVAEELRARGYSVETVGPDDIPSSHAELEVTLEACSQAAALQRAGEMAAQLGADVYIEPGLNFPADAEPEVVPEKQREAELAPEPQAEAVTENPYGAGQTVEDDPSLSSNISGENLGTNLGDRPELPVANTPAKWSEPEAIPSEPITNAIRPESAWREAAPQSVAEPELVSTVPTAYDVDAEPELGRLERWKLQRAERQERRRIEREQKKEAEQQRLIALRERLHAEAELKAREREARARAAERAELHAAPGVVSQRPELSDSQERRAPWGVFAVAAAVAIIAIGVWSAFMPHGAVTSTPSVPGNIKQDVPFGPVTITPNAPQASATAPNASAPPAAAPPRTTPPPTPPATTARQVKPKTSPKHTAARGRRHVRPANDDVTDDEVVVHHFATPQHRSAITVSRDGVKQISDLDQ